MKWVKFFITLIVTMGLIILGNRSISTGSLSIPPLGKFLCPFDGFWQNATSVNKIKSQTFVFPELQKEVKVIYDKRMVPHIFASNKKDAFFVQGYITARERLWQMDISVRAISGRLSEIIGDKTVNMDKLNRRKGLLWAAESTLEKWKESPEDFELLESYVAGANTYSQSLTEKEYPIEYKLLNYKPEDWTPLKIALFFKSMAEELSWRHDDIRATNALKIFGKEKFDYLYPENNPLQSPIIPAGTEWKADTNKLLGGLDFHNIPEGLIPYTPLRNPPKFNGSNNWAVSGSKTKSGNPILCNDPHLNLTLPSIWFENQMHTPDFNAYGVSLPGVPGMIIGFNENIAWGVTNVGHDVLDWYTIDWANPEKTSYRLDGQNKEIVEKIEEIKVKGKADPVLDTVKYTHWGPVVFEDANENYYDMALHWLGHEKPQYNAINTFLGLMQAYNYDDYSRVLRYFENPAQNIAFACKNGDIALKVNGKFPIKNNQQGRFISDGSKSESGWRGFIPYDEIPQVKNPERGFISSANQHSTDPSYPYYYNGGFDDYRGRIINRELEKLNDVTVNDMKALQNYNISLIAEDALPSMLALLDKGKLSSQQNEWISMLQNWNFSFDKEKLEPVLFDMWFENLYDATFDEIYAIDSSTAILFPEDWRLISLLKENPDDLLFDLGSTNVVETAADIVTSVFLDISKEIERNLEKGDFNWQKHKGTFISHLGRIDAFSVKNIPVSGYKYAPNSVKKSHGPSWRMIIELGDEVKAFGVYPGGQSGNPASPYYDNMVETWAKGEYFELFFMKNAEDDRMPILFSNGFKPN